MNLIDIHCHPSMKINLFGIRIDKKRSFLKFLPHMLLNLPSMRKGGLNAAVSVHYLLEEELRLHFGKFFPGEIIGAIMIGVLDHVNNLLEVKSNPDLTFSRMLNIMDKFSNQITKLGNNSNVIIAKNFQEFEKQIKEGKTVFVHSVEGAHCLGSDVSKVEGHLDQLIDRGLCQFTLGHFFENVLVSSSGGIPPFIRDFLEYDLVTETTYSNGYNEKNDIANKVINTLLDKGIVIDLVHCHKGAKKMVYDMNKARGTNMRPLIFSHTGILEVVMGRNPDFTQNDKNFFMDYLPDSTDILEIKNCKGVFGIIFMDYWLNGLDNTDNGIDFIIDTIKFIANVCGNYEHISLGSDMDGFTEVPKDLEGPEFLPNLISRMKSAGISDDDVSKICFENYRRVLKLGWGSSMQLFPNIL